MKRDDRKDRAQGMARHPAGFAYRRQLTQFGLPQPASLVGIDDLFGEAIRLVGMPNPLPRGFQELPGPPETANGQ
jgi:hypothetical protein